MEVDHLVPRELWSRPQATGLQAADQTSVSTSLHHFNHFSDHPRTRF